MTPYAKAQSPPHLSRAAQSKNNFILQQGFPEPTVATRDRQYSAILFQPRLLGLVFVVGSARQRPAVFFTLSAILWFCVMAPRFNPFNALYNGALAPFTGITLTPSPAPRRFSQFLGGAFCLAIAVSLAMGFRMAAVVLEGFLIAGTVTMLAGFCVGTFVFHLVRGHVGFAMRTLPWAAGG
jgi:uncharacterized protein DUF4395